MCAFSLPSHALCALSLFHTYIHTPLCPAGLSRTWAPNETKVQGASLVLLHTWLPCLSLLRHLLGWATGQHIPAAANPSGANPDAWGLKPAPPGATTAPIAGTTSVTTDGTAGPLNSLTPAWCESPGRSAYHTSASVTATRRLGLQNGTLAVRSQAVPPLHRLFHAWAQQLYQLMMQYGHVQVGRICLYLPGVKPGHAQCTI